jgi:hypothetical protein
MLSVMSIRRNRLKYPIIAVIIAARSSLQKIMDGNWTLSHQEKLPPRRRDWKGTFDERQPPSG